MMPAAFELERAALIARNKLRLAPLVEEAKALAAACAQSRKQQQQPRRPRKPRHTGLPARRSSRVISHRPMPPPADPGQPEVQDQDPAEAWEQVLRDGFAGWEDGQVRQTADQPVKHGLSVQDIQGGLVNREQLVEWYDLPFNVAGRIVAAV
jgi:hypothetical protein